MILYAITASKHPHLVEDELCDLIGIHRRSVKRWKELYDSPEQKKNYFSDWLEEFVDANTNIDEHKKAVLEAVGMINATQGNFQFWREMARTQGVIKEEPKNTSITINTDFSQIAIGADFDEARRKMLENLRGVVVEGRPRVANDPKPGEREGSGVGASEMQDRSLVLPDTLGTNRRRSTEREHFSAVPAKRSPKNTN
jgi:hypothetical protein